MNPRLDIDRIIDDRRTRIIVCCGSGGVGKTTTAAAIGLRAAERGRQVCVLTVDPARRLAQSMGLTSLDNTPRLVDGIDEEAGGSLHAMMLDMKRTFDEIVEAHADPARAAQILANPFYQSLSSSFAGTQEYMAMEKLGQLRRSDEWDLIVVDTPPSRSALDFLDAPERLGRFLDGRLIRVLTAPVKAGRPFGRVLNAGFSVMTGAMTKLLGGQVLRDAQTFITAFDTMFGGFRERAEATYKLLQAPGTSFLVIATPEPDALREASYFVERLAEERMPLAGLILNRVHSRGQRPAAAPLSAARSLAAAETLETMSRTSVARLIRASPPGYAADGGGAAAARRADEPGRTRTAGGRVVHVGPPGRSRRRGTCPAGRRARPRRATPRRRGCSRQGSAGFRPAPLPARLAASVRSGDAMPAQALATSSSMPWRS